MDKLPIHVLLIEDLKIAQKVAVMTLSELNCEVDTADSGTQAIALFSKKKYDIIFMDLGLDDTDGLTLTETLRKMEAQNNHVPIIALTAHSDEEIKGNCFKVGMDDFLEKPLRLEGAKKMLEKYIFQNNF